MFSMLHLAVVLQHAAVVRATREPDLHPSVGSSKVVWSQEKSLRFVVMSVKMRENESVFVGGPTATISALRVNIM